MKYYLPGNYVENLNPSPWEPDETGVTWQADVYAHALSLAKTYDVHSVIDLGCGTANKLKPFADADFEVIGFDRSRHAEHGSVYLDAYYAPFDLDSTEPLPLDTTSALIIAADIIEHLLRPERLLHRLAGCRAFVLSTPDRDKIHTPPSGPPSNPSHVREWNETELRQLILNEFSKAALLTRYTIAFGHVRAHDKTSTRDTLMVSGYRIP